jgi:predicted nucleotidyltransferase
VKEQNDDSLLARIAGKISTASGICAIVLGGSRAYGSANSQSDYDLFIYYDPDKPINVASLQTVVTDIDEARIPRMRPGF